MAIATFDVPLTHIEEDSVEFNTSIDGAYTDHEQRIALWTNQRRGWTLSVHYTNFEALKSFFIARKGRFNAFNFTWSTSLGGDGNTYYVRFNTDKLSLSYKNSVMTVPIVQVVTGE